MGKPLKYSGDFNLKQILMFLFSTIGTTFIALLILHYSLLAALDAIGIQNRLTIIITYFLSTIAVSWCISITCSTGLTIKGWKRSFSIGFLSVLLYNIYVFYLLHNYTYFITFSVIAINIFVSFLGILLSQKYLIKDDFKGNQIAILLTSNFILMIGIFIILWILPLSIYMNYVKK